MAQRKFTFRLSEEGVEELKRELTALGEAGDKAFERIKQSSPQLADALKKAEEHAEKTRKRLKDLGEEAGPATRAFNELRGRGTEAMEGLADRAGVAGTALRAVGPAGLAAAAGIGAVVAGAGALYAAGRQAINTLDEIGKAAAMAGVTAEAWQELEFVGSQFSITSSAMADGLKEMSLRADEFAVTGAGPAAEALQRLGYNQAEVNRLVKDAPAFMGDLIRRMQDLDKAAQIRIADEVFGGQGGEQFIQMIQAGGDAFDDLRERAHSLGVVMDESVVRRGMEAKSEMEVMSRVISANLTAAFAELGPWVVQATGFVADFARGLNRIADLVRDIEDQSEYSQVRKMKSLAEQRERLMERIAETESDVASWKSWGVPDAILAPTEQRIEVMRAEAEGLLQQYQNIARLREEENNPPPPPTAGSGTAAAQEAARLSLLQDIGDQHQRNMELAAMEADARAVAQAADKAEADARAKAKERGIVLTEAELTQIREQAAAEVQLQQTVEDGRRKAEKAAAEKKKNDEQDARIREQQKQAAKDTLADMRLQVEVLGLQLAGQEDLAAWLETEADLRKRLGKEYEAQAGDIRATWEEHRRLTKELEAQKEAQKKAEEAAREYAEESKRIAQDMAGDVSEALWDSLTDERKGQSAIEFFKNWGRRLAVEMLQQKIVLPITTQIVQAVPGLFGLTPPAGAQGAAGAGGMGVGIGDLASLGNLFSGSSSLYNIGSAIATSGFGQTIGLSTLQSGAAHSIGVAAVPGGLSNVAGTPVMTGFGSAFAEGLSASPWGIIGSIGANLLFDDLNPVGSTIGGIIGSVGGGMAGSALLGSLLGAAGGPVGAILGAFLGTALGGQFGGGVPHPGASYEAEIGEDGTLGRPSVKSKHMDDDGVRQLGSALEQYTLALSRTLDGARLAGNVGATIDETEGRTAFLTRGGTGTGLESHVRDDGVRFYDFDPEDAESQSRAIARLTLDLAANAEGISDSTRRVIDNLVEVARVNEDLTSETVDGALYLSQHWSEVMDQLRTGVVDLRSAIVDDAVSAIDTMIEQVETFKETVDAGYGADSAEAAEAADALREAIAIFSGLKEAGPAMSAVELQMAQLEARYAELPRLFEAVGHTAEEAATLAAEAYAKTIAKVRDGVNESMALGILQMADPMRANIHQAVAELEAMRRDVEASGADMTLFRHYESLTLARVVEAEAMEEQRREITATIDAFRRFTTVGRDFRYTLLGSADLFPGSPEERYKQALAAYREGLAAANDNDPTNDVDVGALARTALEASKAYNGAVAQYAADAAMLQAELDGLQSVAERETRIAQGQLTALEAGNAHLEAILAAVQALDMSTNTQWSAPGYEHHEAANKVLAELTQYGGAFGGGGWTAHMLQQDMEMKDRAAAVLRAMNQAYRINFYAEGGLTERGLAVVGERGPELVDFGQPARVYTTEQLGAALRTAGGSPAGGGRSSTLEADVRRLVSQNAELLRINRALLDENAGQRRELRGLRTAADRQRTESWQQRTVGYGT